MSELILWKNQEINRLRRDIEKTFRRCFAGFGVPLSLMEFPELFSVNLSETEKALVLTAKLPGMKPEDLDISVTENTVTIRGETKETTLEESDFHHRIEKHSESFSRTISLPRRVRVDKIEATYKDDILEVTMPKVDPKESQGIRIDIK
jgi:HSP20 family protein